MRLVVDQANGVGEYSELNNVSNLPISVGYADIAPANLSAPGSAVSGSRVLIEWDTVNHGNGLPSVDWEDRVYLSRLNQWNGEMEHLGRLTRSRELPGGTSSRGTLSVLLNRVLAGSYWLFVESDGPQQMIDVDRANNQSAGRLIQVSPAPEPDLVALSLSTPPTAWGGDVIPVAYELRNAGTSGLSSEDRWTEMIIYSTSPNFPGGGTRLASFTMNGPLAAGAALSRTNSITLPVDAKGSVYLRFQIDSRYSDSAADSSLFVNERPLPDLQVSALSVPAAARSGEPVSTSFKLANIGGSSIGGFCEVSFWFTAVRLSDCRSVSSYSWASTWARKDM